MYFFKYFISSSNKSKYIDFIVKTPEVVKPQTKTSFHHLVEPPLVAAQVATIISSGFLLKYAGMLCLGGFDSTHLQQKLVLHNVILRRILLS
jgi:hypothetical protein